MRAGQYIIHEGFYFNLKLSLEYWIAEDKLKSVNADYMHLVIL